MAQLIPYAQRTQRPVRWYSPEDWDWVDTIVQTLVARQVQP